MRHIEFTLDQFAPIALYERLKKEFAGEISFLLESADVSEGDYSLCIMGARERVQYIDGTTLYTDANLQKNYLKQDPFSFLKEYYSRVDSSKYKRYTRDLGLGFVDGFVGFIGYDMVQVFEPTLQRYMSTLDDTLNTPDLDLILPKLVAVYSHKTHKVTLIDLTNSKTTEIEKIKKNLLSDYSYTPLKPIKEEINGSFRHTKEHFFEMIERSQQMIRSGDVFQVLMTNRYTAEIEVDPFSLYRILRTKNPSPYMFFMEYEDFSIVGSSPEVMVRLSEGEILLRPIAGTRKRGKNRQEDRELEIDLLDDPKELAEHLMLIDLGRNDVGRVAKSGTVEVEDMMHIEHYSHVMHIVSDVVATLRDDLDMFDLFRATFTAGTMTGAPKIRAMELIAEFEGLKRGFYSGAIGYFGFDGNMDSAITIRTALLTKSSIVLQAGAGIVADSVPESEYEEVQNKLGALLSSLEDLRC